MTTPLTYLLEINWNGDGSTWVDETGNVVSIKARRGKDYASSAAGHVQPGEATLLLKNPSQRFSEFNVSSPLYGNILPGRKVRIRATSPVARTIWQGFIADTNPETGRERTAEATFLCAGPLWWVGEQESNSELQATIASGAAIGKVLDDAGWPAGDRTIDTGQLTMVNWKADSNRQGDGTRVDPRKALSHLHEIEDSEVGALLTESADGKIVWEDAHHRLLGAHVTSQATLSDASGATLPYDVVDQLSAWRFIYNRFVAEVTPVTVRAGGAALWRFVGETPAIPPLGSYVARAIYPPPGSAETATGVQTWNTPTLLANAAPDGTGIDMTSSIGIATVKSANQMVITLTNNDPVRIAYVTQLYATGTPYKQHDTTRVEASDATSISRYGRRTYPNGGRFYPTVARATDFVNWGLSHFKDPRPILEIGYDPRTSDDHMTQALNRDISDRITVVANGTTPSGAQLGISADFFIESVAFEITQSGLEFVMYRVTYAGDSAHAGDDYWRLDYSTLSETTKLVV